jgi:hypothetical protein
MQLKAVVQQWLLLLLMLMLCRRPSLLVWVRSLPWSI